MTMAPPMCSCDGPLADLGLGGRCEVHGSKETKRQLEWATEARDAFRTERDQLREAIRTFLVSEYGPAFDTAVREHEVDAAAARLADAIRAASPNLRGGSDAS